MGQIIVESFNHSRLLTLFFILLFPSSSICLDPRVLSHSASSLSARKLLDDHGIKSNQAPGSSQNPVRDEDEIEMIPLSVDGRIYSAQNTNSQPMFPSGDVIIDLSLCLPTDSASQSNDFDYKSKPKGQKCKSTVQKLKQVTSWQQIFQLGTAAVSYVAGAGVGHEVLKDPFGIAEGALNLPLIVSQLAVIGTEAFLIDKTVYTWDPFAVAQLLEQITIVAAAFSLLSQQSLDIMFNLKKFPHSVDEISSYGGAALFHVGLLSLHGLQAAVLKWDKLQSLLFRQFILTQGYATGNISLFRKDPERTKRYLENKGWVGGTWDQIEKMYQVENNQELKSVLQQSREMLQCLNIQDPLGHVNLNHCQNLAKSQLEKIVDLKDSHDGHSHGHGMAAILADVISHFVSTPTYSIAWLLAFLHVPVSALGVGWTAQLSTIVLLGMVSSGATKNGMKVWKETGGEAPAGLTNELAHRIEMEFKETYEKYIEKVEFATRKISYRHYDLYYVSFYVSVFEDKWKEFYAPASGGGKTLKEEAELKLRAIAYSLKAYDFSKLDRGDKDNDPFKMVYWLLSDPKSTPGENSLQSRANKQFAHELDHMFDQQQVTCLLMQHLENFDPKMLEAEEKSITSSINKAIEPLKQNSEKARGRDIGRDYFI